jgi:ribosome-binding factor A
MNHRIARVREVIQRELSSLIEREFQFAPALATVSHVDITPDLRQCFVYVSVIGSEQQSEHVIASLRSARSELQRSLAKRVILKYTPILNFKLDTSAERGVRILQILEELDAPESSTPEEGDPDHA